MDQAKTTPTNSEVTTNEVPEAGPAKPPFRDPSFFETYANNVHFETSVWDLRMIFSVLDQAPGMPPFRQLGAVHVTWAQAKVMAYYLLVNIAFHETVNGKVAVPPVVTPPPIDTTGLPDEPKAKELVERIARMRTELGV